MTMTLPRYKRLLLVLFIPLLVAGAIFAKKERAQLGNMLCQQQIDQQYCKYVGYSYASEDGDAEWFAINLSNEGFSVFGVGPRLLHEFIITDVEPFSNSSADVKEFKQAFMEKSGVIVLGGPKDANSSLVSDGSIFLYCQSIGSNSENDTYSSRCHGNGWGALFTYKVSGEDRNNLLAISESIHAELAKAKRDAIIMTPIFLVGFLILSLIIYLVHKAYHYVKGD